MVAYNHRFLILLISYVVFLTGSSAIPSARRWEAVNDQTPQFNRGNNMSPEPNLDNISSDQLLKALEEMDGNLPQTAKIAPKGRPGVTTDFGEIGSTGGLLGGNSPSVASLPVDIDNLMEKKKKAEGPRPPSIDGFGGENTAAPAALVSSSSSNAANPFPQDSGTDFNNESPSEINEKPETTIDSENHNQSSFATLEKMGMEKLSGGKPLGLFPRLGGEDKSIMSAVSEMPYSGLPTNLEEEKPNVEADKGGEELDLPQSEEQPEFLSNDQAEAENGGVNENVADKHGDGENESGLSNVDDNKEPEDKRKSEEEENANNEDKGANSGNENEKDFEMDKGESNSGDDEKKTQNGEDIDQNVDQEKSEEMNNTEEPPTENPRKEDSSFESTTPAEHIDENSGSSSTSSPGAVLPPNCTGQPGEWSAWKPVGVCSADCGACGVIQYTRECLSYKHGEGCPCIGEYKITEACNIGVCFYPQPSCCTPYNLIYVDGMFACGPQSEDIIKKFKENKGNENIQKKHMKLRDRTPVFFF